MKQSAQEYALGGEKSKMSSLSTIEKNLIQLRDSNKWIRTSSRAMRDAVLLGLEKALQENEASVLAANEKDVQEAIHASKPAAFIDRLRLTPDRLEGMREGLKQIAALADPIHEEVENKILSNGLKVRRVRAPLGVLLVIFESRPNVAIEAFALATKSGNSVVLRGGKESSQTLTALYGLIEKSLEQAQLPKNCFYGLIDPDRDLMKWLLKRPDLLDVVIPRGGDALIEFVTENSRVPMIKNDRGLCHLFVEQTAQLDMAKRILINAKTQRPGVCNAVETLLVDQAVHKTMLPAFYTALSQKNVEWFCCPMSFALLSEISNRDSPVHPAHPSSFDTEYLDLKINVRVVDGIDEALAHIQKHGSKHSEAIVTDDESLARKFQAEVDAAAVYWNASTRFTDGFELGLGGEIGISTQKLHVRGPVGLKELTNTRWIMDGTGQTRGNS